MGPKEMMIYAARKAMVIEKAIIPPLELGNGIQSKVDHDMIWSIESVARKESNIPIPVPVISAGFDPQGVFLNLGSKLPNNLIGIALSSKVKVPYAMNAVQDIKNTFESYH